MCIAVVDSGATLKAFARMNDAWVGSIDIAIKKAEVFGVVCDAIQPVEGLGFALLTTFDSG